MPYYSQRFVRGLDNRNPVARKKSQIRDLKESLLALDPGDLPQLKKSICKRLLQLEADLRHIRPSYLPSNKEKVSLDNQ